MAETRALPKRISDTELQRRWAAVRREMNVRKLDLLIFQNSSTVLPGNVKWFTDLNFGMFAQPITVIFPREDDMVVIQRALRPAREEAPAPGMRGIKKLAFSPIFWTSLTYSNTWEAEKVVAELSKYKNPRIGWVGLGYLPAAFYKYVIEHLTGASFEDATEMIDHLKAIKSEEEIGLIRETCQLEDRLWEYVLTIVKPGETDVSVRAKIMDKCAQWGAEPNIIVTAAPAGTAASLGMGGGLKTIDEGWQLSLLLETSSPTGYWGELSRTVCIGKIPARLHEQFELAKQAQQLTLNLLRPGTTAQECWETNNAFMRKHGLPEEIRLYAHGQGYDMVEQPCLDPEEPWKLEAGMFLAVHPEAKSKDAYGWVCDDYLIKKIGPPEHFHKTEQKVFVV